MLGRRLHAHAHHKPGHQNLAEHVMQNCFDSCVYVHTTGLVTSILPDV